MRKLTATIVAAGLASGLFIVPAQAHDDDESTPFGEPGMASMANRTFAVTMSDDMRFTPDRIAVAQGETIRFVVRNAGTIRHEMMIGTAEELQEHAKLMQQFPDMEHEDANAVTVDPGKDGEMAWKFTVPGTFVFACLMPGHYESGMKGAIVVAAALPLPSPSSMMPSAHDHNIAGSSALPAVSPGSSAAGRGEGEGEVRKIDKATGKITLRHGPLVGLADADGKDMPGMTMVFRVKEVAELDVLKVGDRVRFTVVRENGALVLPSIERVR